MAQQVIITTPENSGEGTPLATAFDYCNSNFSELYSRVQAPPPVTLIGNPGDQAGMYSYDPTYFYYCFADYDGSTTIWAQIQQAGNISATQIQYGNTIVDIAGPGANVTIAVHGSYNRAIFSNTTALFNTNVVVNSNLTTSGTVFADALQAVSFIKTTGLISATGNISTAAQLSATGNISTDAYFIGDGSQLIGVNLINGNSNVSIPVTNGNVVINVGGATVGTFTSIGLETDKVSATGNITGNYILGNGSQLTGLPATYANSNVAAYLPTYSGNLTADTISTTGNIQGANLLTQGIVSATGNIVTDGYFVGTFVGNVTGNFVVPGSNTQVIFNTNGNADAVGGFTFDTNGPNLLTVLGTISAQSNVVAGNILSGYISSSGNIHGANINANAVSITGNVTANYFNGNGSQLTGMYANADVAAYLPTYTGNIGAGFITATGNVVAGNIRTSGLVSVSGNISAGNISISGSLGATSYSAVGNITAANLNATVAVVSVGNVTGSNLITGGYVLASGNITGANFNTLGLITAAGNVTAGNISTAGLVTATANITGGNIRTAGIVTATGNIISSAYFIGDGSQLTNINVAAGSKIQNGTSQANIASANGNLNIDVNSINIVNITDTGLLTSGIVSAAGNVLANNVSTVGLITATGNIIAGNVSTAGLATVTGNVTAGNVLTEGVLSATGNITTAQFLLVGNGIINTGANAAGNIGSSTGYFNTVFATASKALYADLAENYTADAEYEPGTVVCFDGAAEVTQCNTDMCSTVAGVVSTRPAYTMNSGIVGTVATVALVGRVPCQVKGPVKRGAMMVSAGNGCARAESNPAMGTVIGKALQSFDGETGVIEIVVGRL